MKATSKIKTTSKIKITSKIKKSLTMKTNSNKKITFIKIRKGEKINKISQKNTR